MINIYSEQQNPCSFCKDDANQHRIDNGECLEFSFCGNDTRLFIRETSAEVLPVPQGSGDNDEDRKRLNDKQSNMSFATQKTDKSQQTDDDDDNVLKYGRKAGKMTQQQLKNLYTKKWSGKTYFEEELRKIRNKEYSKEVEGAKKQRNLWHQFQRELARDMRRELVRSSGPEWWQEPSRKQICLAVGLGDVINADYEEEVTGRTRQWLLDLGVTTRLTPRQVRTCMWRSFRDPVDFLLEVHALVVESQTDVKKKKGDLERPFTVNERTLLSAVCVLQLPTLLTMLHYILPPPKPYTEPRQIQELLFGDLDDERVRYSTPYMEPLPFRNKKQFRDWALDKVYTSLLPSIIVDESRTSTKAHRLSKKCTTKYSDQSLSSESSTVLWLISHCMSRRKSPSTLSYYENDGDSRKIFRRMTSNVLSAGRKKGSRGRFSKRATRMSSSPVEILGDYMAEKRDNKSEVIPQSKSNTMITTYQDSSSLPLFKGATLPFEASSRVRSISAMTKTDVLSVTLSKLALESSTRKRSENGNGKSRTHTVDTIRAEDVPETPGVVVSSAHDLLNGVASDKSADFGELKKLWEEISLLPPDKQLRQAVKVLAESGDPLAQLPRVHLLPTLQRWLEMRNGKRILSKQTKEHLLGLSRGMWKAGPVGCVNQGPKVKCSKREERKLTWDKKKWLECEVKKELKDYYSRVRQEKVDNARSFFPTMLNHYDYGSQLNRNFRDVFFTYLPAKEADTYVYRPWQPSETY